MSYTPAYPTPAHEWAAEAIVAFFSARNDADTVLLVNSCARGQATPDSCLDIMVLTENRDDIPILEASWQQFYGSHPVFDELHRAGAFSVVHLDVDDGVRRPDDHPADEYPDFFEVGIGNLFAYSHPLWTRGERFARLKEGWLPYYDEDLRQRRLGEVRWCCQHSLEHIPLYAARGLAFQSFARLWNAFQMFLQALFISRRTYPIAYDKWVREQVVNILGLPELYEKLPHLFEIPRFESDDIVGKARDLQRLLDTYVPA
jgi:hypothetical protein